MQKGGVDPPNILIWQVGGTMSDSYRSVSVDDPQTHSSRSCFFE